MRADIQMLAEGLYPAALVDGGLDGALAVLAASLDDSRGGRRARGRLPRAVEGAAWFVCSEALANVAKHSAASCARVRAARRDGRRPHRDLRRRAWRGGSGARLGPARPGGAGRGARRAPVGRRSARRRDRRRGGASRADERSRRRASDDEPRRRCRGDRGRGDDAGRRARSPRTSRSPRTPPVRRSCSSWPAGWSRRRAWPSWREPQRSLATLLVAAGVRVVHRRAQQPRCRAGGAVHRRPGRGRCRSRRPRARRACARPAAGLESARCRGLSDRCRRARVPRGRRVRPGRGRLRRLPREPAAHRHRSPGRTPMSSAGASGWPARSTRRTAALVAWSLATATIPRRRLLAPALVPSPATSPSRVRRTCTRGIAASSPPIAADRALWLGQAACLAGIAAGVAWERLRVRRTRAQARPARHRARDIATARGIARAAGDHARRSRAGDRLPRGRAAAGSIRAGRRCRTCRARARAPRR